MHHFLWHKSPIKSVPVNQAITMIKNKLEQDIKLHNRTFMSITHLMTLLEFCLKVMYFLFQGKYYEQVHGTALNSTFNPTVANVFMEELKTSHHNCYQPSKYMGEGMLMTHLSSKGQNIGLNFYSISTPLSLTYRSLQRTLSQMDL